MRENALPPPFVLKNGGQRPRRPWFSWRSGCAALDAEARGVGYPFNTILFEATRRCNLACPICMTGSNDPVRVRECAGRELSTEEVEELILAPGKELGAEVMTWSGGEFLLRTDALELVRRAARLGYASSILTSGKGVTRELLRELQSASGGTLVLAVGINSIEDESAWTRDSACSLALRALELCRQLDIKRHVVVNIGRHNLATLARTLQWLEDRNLPFNRAPFAARGSGRAHFAALAFSREEMERVIHPELRRRPNGYISYTPFFLNPDLHARFSGGRRNVTVPQNPPVGCFIGNGLFIGAEGNLAPCNLLLDVLDCGNVREKPLARLVAESPVFQALLDRRNLKGKCGRCRYQFVCGGCRAVAYFHTGDYLAEDPTCFFEPADRTTVSPHEEETNRAFRRYVFMARHAGRNRASVAAGPSDKR